MKLEEYIKIDEFLKNKDKDAIDKILNGLEIEELSYLVGDNVVLTDQKDDENNYLIRGYSGDLPIEAVRLREAIDYIKERFTSKQQAAPEPQKEKEKTEQAAPEPQKGTLEYYCKKAVEKGYLKKEERGYCKLSWSKAQLAYFLNFFPNDNGTFPDDKYCKMFGESRLAKAADQLKLNKHGDGKPKGYEIIDALLKE